MTDLAVIMSIYKNDSLIFVKESVQSILSQTFAQFHFYLIFDGPVSADIDEYISNLQDIRLRLFRTQNNMGLAKALNQLLSEILYYPEYRYIARMDADDISLASRLEIQRNFLLNNGHIACVGSWYTEIDESGKLLSYQKFPISNEEIIKFFWKRSPMAHPSVMFRRELIEKAGYYPTNTLRLEDYILWSNALKSDLKLANVPEYLILYRRDKDFYNRRSGIRFGFNYIKTRFKINRSIHVPFYIYFYSFFVGVIRMMPTFVIRSIYQYHRNHFI